MIQGALRSVPVSLTVQAAVYAAADVVGGKLTLTNAVRSRSFGIGGVIESVVLRDLAAQTGDYDLVIFNADPSATTFTENGPIDVADADLGKVVGVVKLVASTHRTAFADSCVYSVGGLNLSLAGAGSNLYAVLVARGTPTFAATTDVSLELFIRQD